MALVYAREAGIKGSQPMTKVEQPPPMVHAGGEDAVEPIRRNAVREKTWKSLIADGDAHSSVGRFRAAQAAYLKAMREAETSERRYHLHAAIGWYAAAACKAIVAQLKQRGATADWSCESGRAEVREYCDDAFGEYQRVINPVLARINELVGKGDVEKRAKENAAGCLLAIVTVLILVNGFDKAERLVGIATELAADNAALTRKIGKALTSLNNSRVNSDLPPGATAHREIKQYPKRVWLAVSMAVSAILRKRRSP